MKILRVTVSDNNEHCRQCLDSVDCLLKNARGSNVGVPQ